MQIGQTIRPAGSPLPAVPELKGPSKEEGGKPSSKPISWLAGGGATSEADSLRSQLEGEKARRRELERQLEETQKALAIAVSMSPPEDSPPKPGSPPPKVSPIFDEFKASEPATPVKAPAPYDPLAKLRDEVAEARRRYEKEKEEFEREEAQGSLALAEPHGAVPLLAVPIGFLGFDGRTVIARSCFTAGKGEALHRLLGSFLQQWSRWPYPPLARVTRNGLVITLPRDPQQRSIRIMPTGAIFLQMGPQYVKFLRTLPPVVSYQKRSPRV